MSDFLGIKRYGLAVAAMAIIAGWGHQGLAMDETPQIISNWYEALRQSDKELIDALLDDNATIELKDVGVTQTKLEFIEALDEWTELNSDATVLTRASSIEDGEVVMDVCYRFTSNELQMKETFFTANTLIVKSIQEQVSENCTGF